MNISKFIGYGKNFLSFSIGLGMVTPLCNELYHYSSDEELNNLRLQNANAQGKKFSNQELQDHVDKQCQSLKLPKVVLKDCSKLGGGMIMRVPGGVASICVIDPNEFTLDGAKGALNHELGHHYHQHQLQDKILNSVMGSLFFLKRTRVVGLCAWVGGQLLYNSWSRFKERQADDMAIQLSTPNELRGFIQHLEKGLAEERKTQSKIDWMSHIVLDTHPLPSERIEKFQRAISDSNS